MTSFFCRGRSDLDKILETGAEWHVDCGDDDNMVEIETVSRIPIWRTFGRILWHVILAPKCHIASLHGAATWRIQWHDPRATCHIAGWMNSIRHPLWRAAAFVSSSIHSLKSVQWFWRCAWQQIALSYYFRHWFTYLYWSHVLQCFDSEL